MWADQRQGSLASRFTCLVFVVALLRSWPAVVVGAEISLERPAEREFVRDLAGMIDPADEEKIRSICDKRLTDKATPVIVVTIESMAKHGGAGMRIETFAPAAVQPMGDRSRQAQRAELEHRHPALGLQS